MGYAKGYVLKLTRKHKILFLVVYGLLCAASAVLWALDFMGVVVLQ